MLCILLFDWVRDVESYKKNVQQRAKESVTPTGPRQHDPQTSKHV